MKAIYPLVMLLLFAGCTYQPPHTDAGNPVTFRAPAYEPFILRTNQTVIIDDTNIRITLKRVIRSDGGDTSNFSNVRATAIFDMTSPVKNATYAYPILKDDPAHSLSKRETPLGPSILVTGYGDDWVNLTVTVWHPV